jgi:hypothetical protein
VSVPFDLIAAGTSAATFASLLGADEDGVEDDDDEEDVRGEHVGSRPDDAVAHDTA